jgi:Ca2+/Na+ antiporter
MNEPIYIDFLMRVLVIICGTFILVAIMFLYNRNKVAKQEFLKTLFESEKEITPELLVTLGLSKKNQRQRDLRRGVLLVISGLILMTTLFMVGGVAWVFGIVPIVTGTVYLVFSWIKLAEK